MMSGRKLHTFLLGLMAVLIGTVIVLGPGLHALPGFGHQAVANRAIPVDGGLRVTAGDDDASACAICDYLTQGKLVAERVHVVAPHSTTPTIAPLPCILPDLSTRHIYCGRAPPAAHTV